MSTTDPASQQPRTTASTGRRGLRYVPGLDGLRALAVVGVLCFHAGFDWASGGFLGVSAFFVLSGFLITSLLLREHETSGAIRLVAFWERRFRRLMPAALLCLLLVGVYGHAVADPSQLARLRADGLSALLYVANWRFMLSGLSYEELFGTPSPVQHFWSLAIEEQFYLAYPPLVIGLLALGRGSRRLLAFSIVILTAGSALWMAALFQPEHSNARLYYGTDTRAAELLVGALLALVVSYRPIPTVRSTHWIQLLGALGLLSTLGLWFSVSQQSTWLFRGGLVVSSLLTCTVIAACHQPGPIASVLGWAPVRGLGRISYGVYLYHWPIYLWLDAERTGLSAWPLFGMRLAATGVVSIASFYLIEQPVRTRRVLPGWRLWAGAATAAVTVAALLVFVTHDPPAPWFVHHGLVKSRPMPAVPEDDSGPPRIVVVGDSVAWTVGNGLEQWGDRTQKASVWNLAIFACGIARRGEVDLAFGPSVLSADCATWEDWWPVQIDGFRPDLAVVLSGGWDLIARRLPEWSESREPGDPVFDDWLVSEYVDAVDTLSSRGATVVWLTMPCVGHLEGGGMLTGTGAFAAERIRYLNSVILPRVAAERPGKLRLVDLHGHVCDGDAPIADVNPRWPVREDGLHFSRPGGIWLAAWLLPQLLALEGAEPTDAEAR
jgi:peptidoglycan/LPS O-acetylase OafA/YrhL